MTELELVTIIFLLSILSMAAIEDLLSRAFAPGKLTVRFRRKPLPFSLFNSGSKTTRYRAGRYSRLREKIEKPRTGKNVDLKVSTEHAVQAETISKIINMKSAFPCFLGF